MTVYRSDQAGISTIQKSGRELQFPQSKRGAERKEEASPKMAREKSQKGGIRVISALEREEEPYFSRFAPREGKKLAAIGEEIAKWGIETGKAKEALREKK